VPYILALLLTVMLTAILIIPGYYLSAWWNEVPFEEIFGRPPSDFFHFVKSNSLPSTVASMTLAMSIKLTKNWLQSQRRAQALEKEKLETELKFLKSQFNPHFLFNTINSIFVLIHKNPDQASESLAKFSQLLRYQLYDCNAPQIPLFQEIGYLENFVELERLRQEADMEVNVYLPEGMDHDLMIAPFILMPFVENAFKHVRPDPWGKSWIRIDLDVKDAHLDFRVSNSTSPMQEPSVEPESYKGLGLKNVQRRLDLLYAGKYRLRTLPPIQRYSVSLQLDLTRQSIPLPDLTPAS
ncbi:MAG: histidine kinase, partial [Bacteroidota bacterium]